MHVNIAIMRAFVKLREMLITHKDLARKIEEMEKKYDSQFKVVFDDSSAYDTAGDEERRIGFEVRRAVRDTG